MSERVKWGGVRHVERSAAVDDKLQRCTFNDVVEAVEWLPENQ